MARTAEQKKHRAELERKRRANMSEDKKSRRLVQKQQYYARTKLRWVWDFLQQSHN